jgi:hypothetical protein
VTTAAYGEDVMASAPGNRYVHDRGTRHCAAERPCPTLDGKCACSDAVKAAVVERAVV